MLTLAACQSEPTEVPEAAPLTASLYDSYGEEITDEGAVPAQAVVAEIDQYMGQSVKIEGTVSAVCQMRGCWLTFQTYDGNNIRISVPRDEEGEYVFTVPTDISGRRAVVQGTLEEDTLSPEMQQHLAEDAGEDVDEEELEPKQELRMTAQGVLVTKATP